MTENFDGISGKPFSKATDRAAQHAFYAEMERARHAFNRALEQLHLSRGLRMAPYVDYNTIDTTVELTCRYLGKLVSLPYDLQSKTRAGKAKHANNKTSGN